MNLQPKTVESFWPLSNPFELDSIAQYSCGFDLGLFDTTHSDCEVVLPSNLESAVSKRQVEWKLGRYCAKRACWNLNKTEPKEILSNPDRSPIWPAGLVGSITHTQGFVSAAVGDRTKISSIGIDSETLVNEKTFREVQDQILCENEKNLARNIKELNPLEVFTLIFSAKESIYKCLYPLVGRYFSYEEAQIIEIDVLRGSFQALLTTSLTPKFAKGTPIVGNFKGENNLFHTAVVLRKSN